MLINCINTIDPNDTFVINPPAVLPKGTCILYRNCPYIVEEIFYDDENGVVEYKVSTKNGSLKGLDTKVLEYCRNKQKLQAIKYVKETAGIGLKGAKDFVDNLCKKYRIE
jgi:hypothetical protein